MNSQSSSSFSSFVLVDGTEGQAALFADAIYNQLLPRTSFIRRVYTHPPEQERLQTGIHVHLDDYRGLVAALKDAEVVLTFPDGWDALAAGTMQEQVARAAVEAGVELFIPFEWGHPRGFYDGDPIVIRAAEKARKMLRDLTMPYLTFTTGPASDVVLPGLLHLTKDGTKAVVTGNGETKISWLSSEDAALYAARVLTQSTRHQLKTTGSVCIPGDDLTILEVLKIVSRLQGTIVEPVHKTLDQAREEAGSDPKPTTFLSWLMVAWEMGRAKVESDGDTLGSFTPRTVSELLEAHYSRKHNV